MEKSWDLADHDIIGDDAELVIGPLGAGERTSAPTPYTRPLQSCGSLKVNSHMNTLSGGGSCRQLPISNSVHGAASSTAQSRTNGPAAGLAMPLRGPPVASANVYAGGTPVIATASTASRPESGVLRKPRHSAPSGEAASSAQGVHGGMHTACEVTNRAEELVARMQGDILGGDDNDDDPVRSRRGWLPQQQSKVVRSPARTAAPGAMPTSTPQPEVAEHVPNGTPNRRGSSSGGGALPGVSDAAADARPALGRMLSARSRSQHEVPPPPSVVVSVQPRAHHAKAPHPPSVPQPRAPPCPLPIHPVPSRPAGGVCDAGRSGADGLLSGFCAGGSDDSGGLDAHAHAGSGAPGGASARPTQPAPPQKPERRSSSGGGGLLAVFSRGSSARRRSETGPQQAAAQGQQPHQGRSDQAETEDEEDVLPAGGIGGGRVPSGLLKRTASALVSWAR